MVFNIEKDGIFLLGFSYTVHNLTWFNHQKMLIVAQCFRIEAFIGSGFMVYGFGFRLQSLGCRIEAFILGFPKTGVPFLPQ